MVGMKHVHFVSLAVVLLMPAAFADKVSDIETSYDKRISEGVAKLRKMAIRELQTVKDQAMRSGDFKLALKADTAISELKGNLSTDDAAEAGVVSPGNFPENLKFQQSTIINRQSEPAVGNWEIAKSLTL